ncbi:MAG: glycan-binding surface protein [Saprospiraceae bacterium]|nr:IPT/TIG domain-containing protein [Lewinella sp.]
MRSLKFQHYIFLLALAIGGILLLPSCQKDDDDAIDPNAIELLSFGPSPALRGGELTFIGRNLDKVSAIILPVNVNVSTFNSKTADRITLTIPEATVDGLVTLITPDGEITSKSRLTISEPITISSISPSEARAGETVTISGTYLNLIKEVIFSNKKSVLSADFISQSQDKIEVNVPLDAQTGPVIISNGEAQPIEVSSATDLIVTLPVISALSPSPVKAGAMLTVTGSDLDLVQEAVFGGNNRVSDFASQSADEIRLMVPATAQDGELKVIVASLQEVSSADPVVLAVPTITDVAPNPAKPGTDITLTGTDLDLVTSIFFGGDVEGSIISQELEKLVATVPLTAVDDLITVNTAANKSVQSGGNLTLILPTISSVGPEQIKSNAVLTITGDNLDLVTDINFAGGTSATPTVISSNEITVVIPPGTQDGSIVLTTTNGSQITSEQSLTILASNVPIITGYPAIAKPGEMITITGEKLNLLTDVIFPENIIATQFGTKTESLLEVVVPEAVKRGIGVITFVTFEGESTTSPPINFQGVDQVQDEALVFFDFNGTGAKDSWWGNVQIVNGDQSLDGSSYGMVNGNYNGWTDLFWRNSSNNFPGSEVGTNVEDFVIKFDINILDPITGGNIKMRLHTADNDFWWAAGPAAPGSDGSALEATNGWVTMTVEISAFKDDYGWGTNSPTDLTEVPNEFGMAFDNGSSYVNFLIDNVRFERKQ